MVMKLSLLVVATLVLSAQALVKRDSGEKQMEKALLDDKIKKCVNDAVALDSKKYTNNADAYVNLVFDCMNIADAEKAAYAGQASTFVNPEPKLKSREAPVQFEKFGRAGRRGGSRRPGGRGAPRGPRRSGKRRGPRRSGKRRGPRRSGSRGRPGSPPPPPPPPPPGSPAPPHP
ncbi:hypothetical protein BC941DRAFT_475960 [Chlamydoabsidia padenii]|nr:hypothetical protein BC941DRAFT_475960 [Chlamydoabsidia padenii]